MLRQSICLLGVFALVAQSTVAETIQLRDNAAISGKILAEKRDSVAVDVGFTVLLIPRSAIKEILTETAAATDSRKSTTPGKSSGTENKTVSAPIETQGRFYHVAMRPGSPKNVRELVRDIGEAVVMVRTPGGLGSGFFINEEGFLITNFHVIEGETQISIEVYHVRGGQLDRKTYRDVRIVAMNKFQDMALLKIEERNAPKFKHVVIGSSDAMDVGEEVFAVGSPLGLERTVTEGILSTKTRQMQGELYLQTSTQINPGNSGGPLFNMAGEVVGITNMKIMMGEGLGFAIPAEALKFFLDHRDAFAYANDNPSNPYRYLEPPSRTRTGVEK